MAAQAVLPFPARGAALVLHIGGDPCRPPAKRSLSSLLSQQLWRDRNRDSSCLILRIRRPLAPEDKPHNRIAVALAVERKASLAGPPDTRGPLVYRTLHVARRRSAVNP
jgi:hypothetical protein